MPMTVSAARAAAAKATAPAKVSAAKMEVHDEWKRIVTKHEAAEREDLQDLLTELVPYFFSQGYVLDVNKSFIGKRDNGSDGTALIAEFFVKEHHQNQVKMEKHQKDKVAMWVKEATGLLGSARHVAEHTWIVSVDTGE